MSAFHNSRDGERLAERFHKACAWIGAVHIGLGLLMFGWHMLGARDHRENLERMHGA